MFDDSIDILEKERSQQLALRQFNKDKRDWQHEMHRRGMAAPSKSGGGAKEIARRAKQLAKKGNGAGA